MSRFLALVILFGSAIQAIAQDNRKLHWVDSVFATMNKEEKVGQLFVVDMARWSKENFQALTTLAKAGKAGGVIVRKAGPMVYARGINAIRPKVPLLVGADSESPANTFDSTLNFFDPKVLLALPGDSLLKALAYERERQVNLLQFQFSSRTVPDSIGPLKAADVSRMPVLPKAKKGDEERLAFLAGNIFLIAPKNIDAAVKSILKVTRKDKLAAARLDASVKKVLALKYDKGLASARKVNTDNLIAYLNTPEAELLKLKLAEHAVTLLRNEDNLLPIGRLDDKRFASVSIGEGSNNVFTHYLSKYARFTHFFLKTAADTALLVNKLSDVDVIVVGLFTSEQIEKPAQLVNWLAQHHRVIVTAFSDPAALRHFENASALLAAYDSNSLLQQAAAEVIFGGIAAHGKLPLTISPELTSGKSLTTQAVGRFSYSLPEAAGMSSTVLKRIDNIAKEAIAIGATPGCVVLVAKNGKVVYEKSFGSLTYKNRLPVTDETIFDLASVTKVSATLQTVMYMHEKGLIDINKKASVYLPELKGSNKEDFIIKDILTHQAGLWPYLPFWSETVKDTTLFKTYYSHTFSEDYPFPVSDNLFAAKAMKDSLWQWIIKAKIREKPSRSVYDYRYSDMGFYIMQHLAEKMLGEPIEDFLQKNIYRPIGATTTGYLPLRKFPWSQIAPTENDTLFRKSLLVGYVHDQGAAMHGGIAGHAGLFSDANDLAKLGQMWLNKGSYGGVEIFKPETLDFFTAKQYEDSHRGLGWDKPVVNSWESLTTWAASAKTFGHTGFTGTCIWVDPEFNLVYVFLSNRVNPDMNNNKISRAIIRPRIQQVIYQSIFEYCKNQGGAETN